MQYAAMDMSANKIATGDVQMLMIHRYETDYGIYNHDADHNPMSLALVKLHPAEDCVTGSALYERMERFAKSKVGSLFNISFFEFIKQPRHQVLQMFEIAEKIGDKENSRTNEIVTDLENSFKGN